MRCLATRCFVASTIPVRRDYFDERALATGPDILRALGLIQQDYNTQAPHSALGMRAPLRVTSGARGRSRVTKQVSRHLGVRTRMTTITMTSAPVLVVGMGSSGTRMVVRTLETLGIFMGGALSANKYAEPLAIVESRHTFVDPFRYHLPLVAGWRDLVDQRAPELQAFCRETLPDLYAGAGYCGGRWGMKDPRLTLLAHVYRAVFPAAVILHVVRDPRDVARTKVRQTWHHLPTRRRAEHWIRVWANVVTIAEGQRQHAAAGATLRYEDLCLGKQEAVVTLSTVLGIPSDDVSEALRLVAKRDRIGRGARGPLPDDVVPVAAALGYE